MERAQRQAVNAIIQGSAAGILKMAMIEMHRYLSARGWHIIATVHDEVILLVDETITEDEKRTIAQIMTGVVKLDVPLKVDVDTFRRWGT